MKAILLMKLHSSSLL